MVQKAGKRKARKLDEIGRDRWIWPENRPASQRPVILRKRVLRQKGGGRGPADFSRLKVDRQVLFNEKQAKVQRETRNGRGDTRVVLLPCQRPFCDVPMQQPGMGIVNA